MKYDDASWHFGGDFPKDLPQQASATHTGMYLAWALSNGLAGELHDPHSSDAIARLQARSLTPGVFFLEHCDGQFTDEDLNEEGNAFTAAYYDLLKGKYVVDYEKILGPGLPGLYHVADSWENFDKMKLILDQRFSEWQSRAG